MLRLQNSTEPSPNPRSTHASGALEGHEIVQREIAPVGGGAGEALRTGDSDLRPLHGSPGSRSGCMPRVLQQQSFLLL